MTAAAALYRAVLDRAGHDGRVIQLWWRDDDAVRDGPALGRLLRLSGESHSPVALAAIPTLIEPSLLARVSNEPLVDVLVHGFSHTNHACAGQKPAEFGPDRPLTTLMEEVRRARALAMDAFGEQVVDVFVPPWNRISPELAAALPSLGFRGLSAFGEHGPSSPRPVRVDAHLDPVDWRGGRGLVPPERFADGLQRALSSGVGPIGLLTHHLVFDEPLWALCEEFIGAAAHHPAVRVRSVRGLLRDLSPSSHRDGRHASLAGASTLSEHAP